MNKSEVADLIISLYNKYGNANYIGEKVSQIEHAIQAAQFAETLLPNSPSFIIGALLHDIGHLLYFDDQTIELMGDVGVLNHENVGVAYLKKCSFNDLVCYLVEQHVNAKRYLISTNENYFKELSEASLITLKYQGGLMSNDEIDSFKSNTHFEMTLLLRECDDKAKVENCVLPNISFYKEMLMKVMV